MSDRDKATALWSLAVRTRDRCCQYCGQWGWDNDRGLPVVGLEAAHIISRNHNNTRTVLENGIALCHYHHRFFTEHPAAWLTWARDHVGQATFDLLHDLSRQTTRPDWDAEIQRLRAVLSNTEAIGAEVRKALGR